MGSHEAGKTQIKCEKKPTLSPDGFMGAMGAPQAYAKGSASSLPTDFDDGFQTMALAEALYRSVTPGIVISRWQASCSPAALTIASSISSI
jgi:hypothetical protein